MDTQQRFSKLIPAAIQILEKITSKLVISCDREIVIGEKASSWRADGHGQVRESYTLLAHIVKPTSANTLTEVE